MFVSWISAHVGASRISEMRRRMNYNKFRSSIIWHRLRDTYSRKETVRWREGERADDTNIWGNDLLWCTWIQLHFPNCTQLETQLCYYCFALQFCNVNKHRRNEAANAKTQSRNNSWTHEFRPNQRNGKRQRWCLHFAAATLVQYNFKKTRQRPNDNDHCFAKNARRNRTSTPAKIFRFSRASRVLQPNVLISNSQHTIKSNSVERAERQRLWADRYDGGSYFSATKIIWCERAHRKSNWKQRTIRGHSLFHSNSIRARRAKEKDGTSHRAT